MPLIQPLRKDILEYLAAHKLIKKWEKIKKFFTDNPWHPSLHTELLEPKQNLIYNFRIDRKYRALFLVHVDNTIEIIKVTKHYS